MKQAKLKFEYTFIIELLAMIGEDNGTIRYEVDVPYNASYLAGAMQDEGLPDGVPWTYPIILAADCAAVLLGSGCKHTVNGVRSALQVYRRGDTGEWLESWQY